MLCTDCNLYCTICILIWRILFCRSGHTLLERKRKARAPSLSSKTSSLNYSEAWVKRSHKILNDSEFTLQHTCSQGYYKYCSVIWTTSRLTFHPIKRLEFVFSIIFLCFRISNISVEFVKIVSVIYNISFLR